MKAPVVDQDEISIMIAARDLSQTFTLNKSNTLGSLVVGVAYMIFPEGVVTVRFPAALFSILSLLMIFFLSKLLFDTASALWSVFIAGFCPALVFISCNSTPYSLLNFLILLYGYYLVKAFRGSLSAGIKGGFILFLAFISKSFSIIFFLVPIIFIVNELILNNKERNKVQIRNFLATSVVFLFCFILYSLWRYPSFGLNVFRDHPVDAKLLLEETAWKGSWQGLLSYKELFFPLLLPLSVCYLSIPGLKDKRAELNIFFYMILLTAIFLIANPVHHFARICIPAVSLLCIIAGNTLKNISHAKKGYMLSAKFSLIVVLNLFCLIHMAGYRFRLYEIFDNYSSLSAIIRNIATVTLCFFLGVFAYSKSVFLKGMLNFKILAKAIIVSIILWNAILGPALVYRRLYQNSRPAYLLTEALLHTYSNTILGGRDMARLLGKKNFRPIDLPPEMMSDFFTVTENLEGPLNQIGAQEVIFSHDDLSFQLVDAFAEYYGFQKPQHLHSMFADLSKHGFDRVFTNGHTTLFRHRDFDTTRVKGNSQLIKKYIPPFVWSFPHSSVYIEETPVRRNEETVLAIENNFKETHRYSVAFQSNEAGEVETGQIITVLSGGKKTLPVKVHVGDSVKITVSDMDDNSEYKLVKHFS